MFWISGRLAQERIAVGSRIGHVLYTTHEPFDVKSIYVVDRLHEELALKLEDSMINSVNGSGDCNLAGEVNVANRFTK